MLRLSVCLAVLAMSTSMACGQSAPQIGDEAPEFNVVGIDGKEHSLKSVSADADLVVVCFTCTQCPVAVAYEDRLVDFNKKYAGKKVAFIAINSNSKTEDLDAMKERAEEKGFDFVYAFDESGEAAKAYGAKVTPELFVVQDGKIAYHGAFDDKQNGPTKTYLVSAVDSLLAGDKPEMATTKPFGCGIKSK
jgi:peroxiredoxin